MLWWILLGLLLLLVSLLVYLLVAPLRILIHTADNIYAVHLVPLAKARVLINDEGPWIILRVPFKTFRFNLFEMATTDKEKKAKKEKKKTKAKTGKKRKIKVPVIKLLRAIRVRECRVEMDTGSPIANGMLISAGYILPRNPKHYLNINFMGYNQLDLEVELRAYRFGWALLQANFRPNIFSHKNQRYGSQLSRTAG